MKKIFSRIKTIKQVALGLNARNQYFIRPYNTVEKKAIADSKLYTKRILSHHGIPVTKTYKVVYNTKQLDVLKWEDLPKSFVVKPNEGAHGNGILVFYGKKKNKLEWIMPNGRTMDINHIKVHIKDILEGRFSLGGKRDLAIIEERVINHPILKAYSYKGIPDIRIIVFNKVPIMAMIRLPTRDSNGKGNITSGAIGAGIDIATGITTNAVYWSFWTKIAIIPGIYGRVDKMVDEPRLPLRGIRIPYWNKILEIAVQAQVVTGIGYLGADIAVDRYKGPVVFELNARSGLGIQSANKVGLVDRLERVKGLHVRSVVQGIRIAKTLFGGGVEEEVEALTGKTVVAPVEKIKLYSLKKLYKTQKRKKVKTKVIKYTAKARIDTGELYSQIDIKLARLLGFDFIIKEFRKISEKEKDKVICDGDKLVKKHADVFDIDSYEVIADNGGYKLSPIINIKVVIQELEKIIKFRIRDRGKLIYPVVIGRKDLKDFLIDTGRTLKVKL